MTVDFRNKDMYDCSGWVKVRHTLFSPRKAWYMRILGSTLTLHEFVRDAVALEYSLIGCKVFSNLFPWCFTLKLSNGTKLRISCDSKKEAEKWKQTMRQASNLIFEDEFDLVQKVEETGGRAVFNAVDKLNSSKVRVERIVRDPFDALKKENTESLSRQLYAVQNLGHQSLLWALTTFQESDYAYIVTRRLTGRRLGEVVSERGGALPEAMARNIAKQLVEAISYMHLKGYVLRNVTLDNIWYDGSHPSGAKVILSNFSNVAFVDDVEDLRMRSVVGDVRYQAPEMLKGVSYCAAVDMFALGVCVYRMLCGSFPFGISVQRRCKMIDEREQEIEFGQDAWRHISEEAKSFVKHLLVPGMFSRVTASAAEHHPWFSMDLAESEKGPEAKVETVTSKVSKEAGKEPEPESMVKPTQLHGVSALLKQDEAKLSPLMRRLLRPLSAEVPLSEKSAVDQFAQTLRERQSLADPRERHDGIEVR